MRAHRLIQTKFSPLQPDPGFVMRDRLFAAMMAPDSPVNLISIIAAAGSGKSVLMGQLNEAVKGRQWRSCWISLDADDNTLSGFVAYLTAALETFDGDIGERAWQASQIRHDGDAGEIFRTLCEDVTRLEEPAFIFLDDFQHITNSDILNGLDRMLQILPKSVRLVIASRTEPGLDTGRKIVDGTALVLDQGAMGLSRDESSRFLSHMHNLDLAEQDSRSLFKTTEGWVAGLQLAALALKTTSGDHRHLIDRFSGRNQNLSRYLMETVFSKLQAHHQEFLLATAPLGRMNGRLCAHVSGMDNAPAILQELYQQNLFIIALDTEQGWFRYHHLFADFLVSVQRDRNKEKYLETCQRASQWFLEKDLITEAIHYLFLTENYTEAAEIIAHKGVQVSRYEGDHRTLLGWVEKLPEAYRMQHPLIMLNYAWSLVFTLPGDQGLEIAQSIRERLRDKHADHWGLDEKTRAEMECIADSTIAVSHASNDQVDQAETAAEYSLDQWPDADPFHKGSIHNVIAYYSMANMEFDQGLEAAARARQYGLESGSAYVNLWADWLSAIISVKSGQPKEAEMYLRRVQDSVSGDPARHSYPLALTSVLLAEIHCDRGDYIQGRKLAWERTHIISLLGSMEPLLVFHKTEARLLFSEGKAEEALHNLREAQETGLAAKRPRISLFLAAEEIKLLLRLGRTEAARVSARRWGFLEEGDNIVQRGKYKLQDQTGKLIRARLALAEGQYEVALKLIMGLINLAKSANRNRMLVELLILRSQALWRTGRRNDALRAMANATGFAASQGLFSPFLETFVDISECLETLARQRQSMNSGTLSDVQIFESRLLERLAIGLSEISGDAGTGEDDVVIEDLTNRETEILVLVEQGFGNAQLADILLVSVATVKWHLANIYSKLGVKNRMAAVARARKLNLLSL